MDDKSKVSKKKDKKKKATKDKPNTEIQAEKKGDKKPLNAAAKIALERKKLRDDEDQRIKEEEERL